MTRLNSRQLRDLNRVILSIHEDLIDPLPIETMVDLLESLLPTGWVSVDEAKLDSTRVSHRAGRRLESLPQAEERVALYCHENPVVAYVLKGNFSPALRVSDFIGLREFKRTAYYNEIARYLSGWRDQAAIAIRLPKSFLGFGLSRDRTFSDEELLILEMLQPHFERVLHRCTQYLHLATEQPITPREREVLHWVAEGKRDSEVALIFGISVRTVEQHVRVCLQKLGVETRTAACAAVWRARRGLETV